MSLIFEIEMSDFKSNVSLWETVTSDFGLDVSTGRWAHTVASDLKSDVRGRCPFLNRTSETLDFARK